MPEQRLAQTQQRRRKVQERRAIAQCARFALHKVDVVLPVVAGLAAARQPGVTRDDGVRGRHIDSLGIDAGADDVAGPLARHGIAVASGSHQAGAADPGQPFDVAVEGGRHGHEVRLLQLPHLGHGELPMDRVRGVAPHRTTPLAQPGIEFDERAEATGRGFDPDAPAAVLHVLLHHPLLPARGDVAEVGIEQVVTAHGCEARVDRALLAALHLVHGGAHVVVDAAPGDTAKRLERAGVRVEQHLMALAGVGRQPEGPAGAQLQVRHLHVVEHAADEHGFDAPVELKGLAQLEAHRNERLGWTGCGLHPPAPDVVGDGAVAAAIALGLYLSKQSSAAAPSLLGAMAVGRERLMQDRLERS